MNNKRLTKRLSLTKTHVIKISSAAVSLKKIYFKVDILIASFFLLLLSSFSVHLMTYLWKLLTRPIRPLRSSVEAPVWCWFPGHVQSSWHVAGRARGGGGRPLRAGLRQPRRATSRESRARVGHALSPLRERLPGEGVGEERDERHRGAASPQTRPQRQIPASRLGDKLHPSAQLVHRGQRAAQWGCGATAACQTAAAGGEDSGRLTSQQEAETLTGVLKSLHRGRFPPCWTAG